ncbi:MAG: tellurite resistance TerB family protein [Rhodobacteraceae bacterium]|nr:MAG: tellurite resistance TerB family protein [Paracoccaceae bacterium]
MGGSLEQDANEVHHGRAARPIRLILDVRRPWRSGQETAMNLGAIVGDMLQQGIGAQTKNRLNTAASAGGGLEDAMASLFGAMGGAGAGGAGAGGAGVGGQASGLAELVQGFFKGQQAGGMSGAQIGGLGAAVGALLGGGTGAARGAAGGGAMAILGALAYNALKTYAAQEGAPAPAPETAAREATSPEAERLVLRAMIAAAKADGHVDAREMDRIVGRLSEAGEAERRFVMAEMAAPIDVAALAAEATSPQLAAEVYAASLLAVDIDTDAERDHLRALAAALRLPRAAQVRLHEATGAPMV